MFIKRLATGMACTALLAPQFVLAATPQQLLDRAASMSLTRQQPQVSTVDVTFNFNYRPITAGQQAGGVKVHIIANAETLPRSQVSFDTEQRLRVESLEVMGAQELGLGMSMRWKDPASFEMKKIGNIYYLRVASLSDEVRTMINNLQVSGLNLDHIVGRWLQIDVDQLQQSLQEVFPMTGELKISGQSQEDITRQLLPIVQKPGLLRAVRLESRTNRGGVMYSRVQFQVNPVLWTQLETMLRKQIEKDLASLKTTDRKAYNTQYAAQTKELRTAFASIRTRMNKIRMVAVVNEQTGMIERVEAAGKFVEPSYTEQYASARSTRLVKRLSGYNEFGFTLISAMKTVANRQLTSPTEFTTLQSLIQMAKQKVEAMNAVPVAY